jgi:hypothetical protein
MEVGGARLTRILSFMMVLYLLIHDGTFRGVSSCLSYLGFSARAFVSLGKVEQLHHVTGMQTRFASNRVAQARAFLGLN